MAAPAPTPPPRPSHPPTSGSGLAVTPYERPSGVHPPLDFPGYHSTALRAPHQPLVLLPHRLTEITGPLLGAERVTKADADLTAQHEGEPQGQRIVVSGRYRHVVDDHPAPLDPNFTGAGRCVTDSDGRYRFITIKPGSYPWRNHQNAWRPAHIHFSLFGRAFTQRLVTQMFFPGDPLFFQDPIFNSVPEAARDRLISRFDLGLTVPEWALGYAWDIVLRGRGATVFEQPDGHR
jgi:protocatechuate 3,4-dioxygenase beta subunit